MWPERLTIIGTGLLGASVGLAARAAGIGQITGYDASGAELAAAAQLGAVTATAASVEDAAAGADLVVAATPVRALGGVLVRAHTAAPGAILTDVGSTKGHLLTELAKAGVPGGRVVPGHPMAGSEERGAAAARDDLFHNAAWALTPPPEVDHQALRRMTRLVRALGGRPLVLDPDLHDRVVAYASHLPQLTATSLMGAVAGVEAPDALRSLVAAGFRDTTRVAASDPEVWVDICLTNTGAILAALDELDGRLGHLRGLVAAGDTGGLRAVLAEAQTARRRIPAKPGVPGYLQQIVVHIADEPGSLAAITGALGAAGVNVEDVAIEHDPQGGGGSMRVWVAGQHAATAAVQALRRAGWRAQEAEPGL